MGTIKNPENSEVNSWQDDSESNSIPLLSDSSVRRGIDFGSDRAKGSKKAARAVRLRIMALMVLLLAVIFAMKEAGKPERWMWMGFDNVDQAPQAGDFLIDARGNSNATGSQDTIDWALAKSASGPAVGLLEDMGDNKGESAIGFTAAELGQLPGNGLDREFWQAAYKRLSDERQLQLFRLLRKVVRSDFAALADADAAELKEITKRLAKEQSDFQTLALGEISLLSDAQEKQQKTQTLFDFDQRWQQDVMPTFNAVLAGTDYTFAGQIEIRKVAQLLRPLFLDAVEDMAGVGTRGDLPGWMTVWDEAVAGRPVASATSAEGEVSFLQLSGQPHNYRGKSVAIEGQARTCRKKLLEHTRLPVDHYYEVWVEPLGVDGDGLFCVYAAEIPDAFPVDLVEQESGKFHDVDVPVSLTGRFFKVRSYRDLGGGVSHSPVVIARQIDTDEAQMVAEVSAARTIPSTTSLAFWFVGIVAVATGLAIVVFRTSRTHSRQLGQSSAKRMHRSLELLGQDPSIKTAAQRVADLANDEAGKSEDDMEQETDQ